MATPHASKWASYKIFQNECSENTNLMKYHDPTKALKTISLLCKIWKFDPNISWKYKQLYWSYHYTFWKSFSLELFHVLGKWKYQSGFKCNSIIIIGVFLTSMRKEFPIDISERFLVDYTIRAFLKSKKSLLSPTLWLSLKIMLLNTIYTAWTSDIKHFSTCFHSADRAPTEPILPYIDGIWSSRQNEPDFLKIGPELWSPGPKNRKKSKPQKSRFF